MALELETATGDELAAGGGNWLKEKGTYHFACIAATDAPETKDGRRLDAVAKFTLQALAGTVAGQEGKTFDLLIWPPKLNSKDGGKMARRKITRTLLAFGLIREEQVGQKVSVDVNAARGRQIIATLDSRKEDDGKEYLDLHFDDIYHVDHPDAKAFPKDAKALGLLPATMRRDAASFNKFEAAPGANGSGSGNSTAGKQTQPALDLADL